MNFLYKIIFVVIVSINLLLLINSLEYLIGFWGIPLAFFIVIMPYLIIILSNKEDTKIETEKYSLAHLEKEAKIKLSDRLCHSLKQYSFNGTNEFYKPLITLWNLGVCLRVVGNFENDMITIQLKAIVSDEKLITVSCCDFEEGLNEAIDEFEIKYLR